MPISPHPHQHNIIIFFTKNQKKNILNLKIYISLTINITTYSNNLFQNNNLNKKTPKF